MSTLEKRLNRINTREKKAAELSQSAESEKDQNFKPLEEETVDALIGKLDQDPSGVFVLHARDELIDESKPIKSFAVDGTFKKDMLSELPSGSEDERSVLFLTTHQVTNPAELRDLTEDVLGDTEIVVISSEQSVLEELEQLEVDQSQMVA